MPHTKSLLVCEGDGIGCCAGATIEEESLASRNYILSLGCLSLLAPDVAGRALLVEEVLDPVGIGSIPQPNLVGGRNASRRTLGVWRSAPSA